MGRGHERDSLLEPAGGLGGDGFFGRPAWLWLFYFNVFFSCIGFSIIVPSLAPCLARMHASENFLGVVVAIYSFGEMLGSLGFGKAFELDEVEPGEDEKDGALRAYGFSWCSRKRHEVEWRAVACLRAVVCLLLSALAAFCAGALLCVLLLASLPFDAPVGDGAHTLPDEPEMPMLPPPAAPLPASPLPAQPPPPAACGWGYSPSIGAGATAPSSLASPAASSASTSRWLPKNMVGRF